MRQGKALRFIEQGGADSHQIGKGLFARVALAQRFACCHPGVTPDYGNCAIARSWVAPRGWRVLFKSPVTGTVFAQGRREDRKLLSAKPLA